ncbi:MAG: pglI 3 [Myxococcales bacterium]|nr:pglI 3 [Myxococcales bacterium]
MTPRFSIIIPTRNRAHTLEFAILSALDHAAADVEIVVSDNHSSDDSAAVVERYAARGVRYLKPPESMTMPAHWNWAAAHARGEWLTILADDDALCPSYLPRLRAVLAEHPDVSVVTWLIGRYFHNVPLDEANKFLRLYYDPAMRNKLELHSFSAETQRLTSRPRLDVVFAVGEDSTVPRGHNCAIRRALLEKLSAERGIFLGLCPDYACSAILLAATESYVFVDEPLQVFGSLPRGGAQTYAEQIAADFKNVPLFDGLPMQSPVLVVNHITDTLLKARAAFPALLGRIDVDWVGYFLRARQEIGELEEKGVDITTLEHDLARALASQPVDVRRRVHGTLRGRFPSLARTLDKARHHPVAKALRRVLYASPLVDSAIGALRGNQPRRWLDTFDGNVLGFSNIHEAARFTARSAETRRERR